MGCSRSSDRRGRTSTDVSEFTSVSIVPEKRLRASTCVSKAVPKATPCVAGRAKSYVAGADTHGVDLEDPRVHSAETVSEKETQSDNDSEVYSSSEEFGPCISLQPLWCRSASQPLRARPGGFDSLLKEAAPSMSSRRIFPGRCFEDDISIATHRWQIALGPALALKGPFLEKLGTPKQHCLDQMLSDAPRHPARVNNGTFQEECFPPDVQETCNKGQQKHGLQDIKVGGGHSDGCCSNFRCGSTAERPCSDVEASMPQFLQRQAIVVDLCECGTESERASMYNESDVQCGVAEAACSDAVEEATLPDGEDAASEVATESVLSWSSDPVFEIRDWLPGLI